MMKMKRRQFLQFTGGFALTTIQAHSELSANANSMSQRQIEIRAWNSDGYPLEKKILARLYFLTLSDEPLPLIPQRVEDGELFAQPPEQLFAIALKMPIEGFGKVTLYADNQGVGYSPLDFPLELNFALAQSRLYRVNSALSRWQQQGYEFSRQIRERLEKAEATLNKAQTEANLPRKIKLCNDSLAQSLWAGEEAIFSQAQQAIIQQGSRANFLFGCNFFGHPSRGSEYDQRFKELFNFATVPFYWGSFEPQAGQKDFDSVEQKVNWLNKFNIAPKGHPLVWFHEAGVPDWIKDKSYQQIKQLTYDRVKEITAYYGEKIPYYDIINEPHGISWANELNYSLEQFIELTRIASQAARAGNQETIRIINNCCLWAENIPYNKPPQHSPYEYLQACLKANIEFEIIGLQLYYPDQDMFEINRMLERFAQLGKPIHITELGVSSATTLDENAYLKKPLGLWHDSWSEEIQADWLEQFYTICYSKPYIHGISWWDLADGGNFWPHGGLLHHDLTPKLAFSRLSGLIKLWRQLPSAKMS